MLPLRDSAATVRNMLSGWSDDIHTRWPAQVTKDSAAAGRNALKRWKHAEYYEQWKLAHEILDGKALDGMTKEQVVEALGKPFEGPFKCNRGEVHLSGKGHGHPRENEIGYKVESGMGIMWTYLFIHFDNGVVVTTVIEERP